MSARRSVEIANKCVICEQELPPIKPGAGRRAKFCGTPCRRAREFEIRRIQARLSRLEDEAEKARRFPLQYLDAGQIDSEISGNRDRLLILLD